MIISLMITNAGREERDRGKWDRQESRIAKSGKLSQWMEVEENEVEGKNEKKQFS